MAVKMLGANELLFAVIAGVAFLSGHLAVGCMICTWGYNLQEENDNMSSAELKVSQLRLDKVTAAS